MTTATITAPFTIAQIAQALPGRVMKLLALKGQIVTLTMERECKVRKGEMPIVKTTTMQVRVGVSYDNMQAVKDKRDEGTLPTENAGLPWGEWAVYPYVIAHKGVFYFRFSTIQTNHKATRTFTRNGVEITADEAKVACLASEFADKDGLDVMTLKVETIKAINGVEV